MITPLQAKTILIIGDSLSAAYGIEEKQGWVSLLKKRLEKVAPEYTIINSSVSGDTTRNALSKLPGLLKTYKPSIIIFEVGANDGLRGLPIKEIHQNLENLILQSKQKTTKILLLATLLPPNYGPLYLKQYQEIYQDLAKQYQLVLIPMFLDGVADEAKFMQEDGLHPNQLGQQRILDNIWLKLHPLL